MEAAETCNPSSSNHPTDVHRTTCTVEGCVRARAGHDGFHTSIYIHAYAYNVTAASATA